MKWLHACCWCWDRGQTETDTHPDTFEGKPRRSAVLEQAMSAPPADLQAKGLLDQTLGVLGTEFGRTPRINDNDGRN